MRFETVLKSPTQYVLRVSATSQGTNLTIAWRRSIGIGKLQVNGIDIKPSWAGGFRFPFEIGGTTYNWIIKPSTSGMLVENLKQIEVTANGEVVFGDVVS
ncbi:hypothetical protein AB0J72_33010 [Dactylosporangium sp. NPDC049742]|uniref:hypothetical protein n=1 Tax=Dactylosporangium sp. NPDC049742 TaxID=3154737 RepID=UPI0034202DBE